MHALTEVDNDNVTAVNNSAMAPSGRGEVGGSTIPAGGGGGADAPTSCIAASMAAAHAPAASQPDASVHMGQAHGTGDPGSESNQQEGEQDQPRRGRGRPKVCARVFPMQRVSGAVFAADARLQHPWSLHDHPACA